MDLVPNNAITNESQTHMILRLMLRSIIPVIAVALAASASPALSQDRGIAFSLTGGAQVAPEYFGARNSKIGPSVGFAFGGTRFGGIDLGTLDGPVQFAQGVGLQGAFRFIGKRKGTGALQGLNDVKASLEVGLGAHYTEDLWQVYGDVRYGAIGHRGIAGELGANAIFRADSGMVLHAGPRAEFGNRRFMNTYFGVGPGESAFSAPFTASSGFYSYGLEAGAYQPLGQDWGVTGTVRFDRLRGDAAASPIVQQGTRNQITAEIGLTRHFNFRF